jgi:hypothetical protein
MNSCRQYVTKISIVKQISSIAHFDLLHSVNLFEVALTTLNFRFFFAFDLIWNEEFLLKPTLMFSLSFALVFIFNVDL